MSELKARVERKQQYLHLHAARVWLRSLSRILIFDNTFRQINGSVNGTEISKESK
jgi:hypothetical protein